MLITKYNHPPGAFAVGTARIARGRGKVNLVPKQIWEFIVGRILSRDMEAVREEATMHGEMRHQKKKTDKQFICSFGLEFERSEQSDKNR